MSTLFLGKATEWCRAAERLVIARLPEVTVCTGNLEDPFPDAAAAWKGESIISFVSPWVVPACVLERATKTSINFHPGPPEYPGIGCYNFALYHGVSEYGVTCHHMLAKVDTGPIIKVKRFPIDSSDSVATLKARSMNAMLELLDSIIHLMSAGSPLPQSVETWTRPPFTRRELNELGRITPDMPATEVQRRYRAMHFPPYPGLFVELGGITFRA